MAQDAPLLKYERMLIDWQLYSFFLVYLHCTMDL